MILVSKNDNLITIVNDGIRLIIDKNNNLFDKLNKKSKEEIINWYLYEKEVS